MAGDKVSAGVRQLACRNVTVGYRMSPAASRRAVAAAVALVLCALAALALAVPPSAQASAGARLVQRADGLYCLKDGVEQYEKWVTVKGKRYYLTAEGTAATGPVKIGARWYLFNSKGVQKRSNCRYKGVRFYLKSSGAIEARSKGSKCWYADGTTRMTATDKADFTCLQYAKKRLARITGKGDSKATKRKKAFKWVMKQPYVTHRRWDITLGKRWTALYAMDMLKGKGGDCQSTAASFAYLAAAIGYTKVQACVDNWKLGRDCHAWCMIKGRIFDPMFAEQSWSTYYNSKGGSYEVNPTRRFAVPQYSAAHATKPGKRPSAKLVKGAKLVMVHGALCIRKGGKLVKKRWCRIGGRRCYAKADGRAATGPAAIGGTRYVFSAKGKLLTGKKTRVVKVGGARYRVKKTGVAKPGWNKAGTRRYLASGELACGVRVIGGKLWAFGSASGVYDAKKTRALRAAYGYRKDASALIALIGPGTLTSQASCLTVNGASGRDAFRKYDHFTLRTWIADDGGAELILGL